MSLFLTLAWIFLISGTGSDAMHDFHLSKSDIHYNEDSHTLEISLHLFIDDLELAIQNQGMDNPFISTSKEVSHADSLIANYLEKHFSVEVNGQKINFNFLGKENSDDLIAIWCYLEGENIPDPQVIKLENRLLIEIYDDQKNIVAFRSTRKKEFLLFDLKRQQATINL